MNQKLRTIIPVQPSRVLSIAVLVLFLVFLNTPVLLAQDTRKAWDEVSAPVLLSIEPKAAEATKLVVAFELLTGSDGADKATVEMLDASGKIIEQKSVGRSKSIIKSVELQPPRSGLYYFRVTAMRNLLPQTKVSQILKYSYSLPLEPPAFRVMNTGGGGIQVSWTEVPEAEGYEVTCSAEGEDGLLPSGKASLAAGGLSGADRNHVVNFNELTVGRKYVFTVAALRGDDRVVADSLSRTVKDTPDREWNFAWFGQSSKAELNTITMIDADEFIFSLRSCSILPDGQIDQKGGKFTAFHDGLSFYYTIIDPEAENFILRATFTVDYINPTADGQEGFGLLAMDSLGEHGVSMKNHYTNSVGIIATKFEETIAGIKRTSKDTLGSRFVTGLSREVIDQGDSGIALNGRSVSRAYSYDSGSLVKKGDVYTLILMKTNSGYHTLLDNPYAPEELELEHILYGPEKLLQLDSGHVYAGFAVARGCNVTVSNVSMTITDPKKDPPGQPAPPELIPLRALVDSPPSYTEASYPFVFNANAAGSLTVIDGKRQVLINKEKITADADFIRLFNLSQGINDYRIIFTPDPGFRPAEGQVMASWDRELSAYVESYHPVNINHSVIYHSFDNPELWVAADGEFLGRGTKESPLDLTTALLFVKPGQTILLRGGIYYPNRMVNIPRGFDGKPDARRIIRSAEGERAILDFSLVDGGMSLWGDYWTIKSLDIRNTRGNIKGLQIAGDNNIVEDVAVYNCGDTGIQISGASAEPMQKWPKNNLILNCTSYNNCDPAANNADGFAAKLTCGEGNVFRGCIAFSNIDDGWDLFSKIESGPIGAVLIESCVAYKNGSLLDGSGNGDGNGFKLGGDGISIPHVLRNSIAYANGASGITSNSNPAVVIIRNTSYGNKGANINLYGKTSDKRLFIASRNISLRGGSGDVYREMPELESPDNFFWNGAQSLNSEGRAITEAIFQSLALDPAPGRHPDGRIDMKGLLMVKELNLEGIGANPEEYLRAFY